MQNYSRPLNTNISVEDFLTYTLDFDYKKEVILNSIVTKIVDGELGVTRFNTENQTISSKEMRDGKYREDSRRWELRAQIIDELFTKKRLSNDENILLGKGGALPRRGLKFNRQAFILIGLPASGKSSISTSIAEDYGAIILDSDYAKRKLPEFQNHLYGASIVHEESSQITFGFENNPLKLKSLYEHSIERESNIIIPRIGQNPQSIIELAEVLKKKKNYDIHLILVSLPRRDATIRAIYRYNTTNRYVPLGLIFDKYGNDPSHCYYYLRCKFNSHFKSFGVISTINKTPEYTDAKGLSPVKKYNYKNLILQLP